MLCISIAFQTRPHLMRSSYLSLFKFFFGSGGRSAGFSERAVEHSTKPSDKLPSASAPPAIHQQTYSRSPNADVAAAAAGGSNGPLPWPMNPQSVPSALNSYAPLPSHPRKSRLSTVQEPASQGEDGSGSDVPTSGMEETPEPKENGSTAAPRPSKPKPAPAVVSPSPWS
jgi:hypothetical protein